MEHLTEFVSLTSEEIKNHYIQIKSLYEQHLKKYGIILPAEGTNAAYQLIYLFHFQGFALHKDMISNFVLSQNPSASGDQQIRHLGNQKGFYILSNGEYYQEEKVKRGWYCLINLIEPKPAWLTRQNARTTIVNTDDWTTLKEVYHNCCATCGAKEGLEHPYTHRITVLQKGHVNPNLPLEPGNIIPQCEYCNQNVYKNDFVFTLEGRPQSINNPTYILKSTEHVQKQMYEILKEKFGE